MTHPGHRHMYGGRLMRSLMEVRVAAFLDLWRIPWDYERQGVRADAGMYLPDFHISRDVDQGHAVPSWMPVWLEVKPNELVDRVGQHLGLPPWRDEAWPARRTNGRLGLWAEGRIDDVPELAKPLGLARRTGAPVWVVGNPKTNTTVLRIDFDGKVIADRDCQLFNPPTAPGQPLLIDKADAIVRAIREVHG